jgi:putative acetyltransferase
MIIRKETPADYLQIRNINDEAFGQTAESRLVDALRNDPSFIDNLSLVAEIEYRIIGHILFFPVLISSPDVSFETLSLAPMSVLPGMQRKGVGSKLVTEGLSRAKAMGYQSATVLGHPGYYPRFGFIPASRWKIKAPFEAPDEAFMALELKPHSLPLKGGVIHYPEAYFEAL